MYRNVKGWDANGWILPRGGLAVPSGRVCFQQGLPCLVTPRLWSKLLSQLYKYLITYLLFSQTRCSRGCSTKTSVSLSFVKISSTNLHSQAVRARELKVLEKVHLPPVEGLLSMGLPHLVLRCLNNCLIQKFLFTWLFGFSFQMIEKRNRRSPESRDIFELHYQTVNYSYNSISEHQDAERKV